MRYHIILTMGILFFISCTGGNIISECPDSDNDGFSNYNCGGTDCDDNDPLSSPIAAENCSDDKDNDCDGFTDDEDPQNCTASCTDSDADGYQDYLCGGTDCDDSNSAIFPGAVEICNDDLDNNCNNVADSADTACQVCTTDQTQNCATGLAGVCNSGTQTCVNKSWGNCIPNVEQGENAEICNNSLDDDCDGQTDDNDSDCNGGEGDCTPGDSHPCGPTSNNGICVLGTMECGDNGQWGECLNAVYPEDEDCNNYLDDDCDTYTDEEDSDCGECEPGDYQICGPEINVGICSSGTITCGDNGQWGECEDAVYPDNESCNREDDNCDGEVDNGAGCHIPIYRHLATFGDGDHYYSTQSSESGYNLEGISFYLFAYMINNSQLSLLPLYQLYNESIYDHFYITNVSEMATAVSNGYTYERVLGYCSPTEVTGSIPLYRLYSETYTDHFYTTSDLDIEYAIQDYGYVLEGTQCYVWDSP